MLQPSLQRVDEKQLLPRQFRSAASYQVESLLEEMKNHLPIRPTQRPEDKTAAVVDKIDSFIQTVSLACYESIDEPEDEEEARTERERRESVSLSTSANRLKRQKESGR